MGTSIELRVSLLRQDLTVLESGREVAVFRVSTSRYGPGERAGSQCTPRGLHQVRALIGHKAPLGAVFVGRRQTGEVFNHALAKAWPERDWILTRIIWLSGMEPRINRFGGVDSMSRYIYIHGTPDSETLGVPWSHGCIRMSNADVIELFESVAPRTLVTIGN